MQPQSLAWMVQYFCVISSLTNQYSHTKTNCNNKENAQKIIKDYNPNVLVDSRKSSTSPN